MTEHVKDKKFVITGRLATFSRDEAIELIKKNGGVIQPMVTPKTDYLVKGYFQLDLFNEDKKTRKLRITVWEEIWINSTYLSLRGKPSCASAGPYRHAATYL